MYILGIAPPHHDPSACVVRDGQVVSFVEQERLSREKHAVRDFPIEAIEEAIDIAEVTTSEIDAIAVSRDYDSNWRIFPHTLRAGLRSGGPLPQRTYYTVIRGIRRLYQSNEDFREELSEKLADHLGIEERSVPPVQFVNHHLTHAASAFYASGFDRALTVSLDNHGDHLSTAIYTGQGPSLNRLNSFHQFNSLGRYYGDVTEFLGFRSNNGEGKVMGLAPYGNQNVRIDRVLDQYFTFGGGEYDIEELTYRYPGDGVRKLEADLDIERRYWRDEITQEYKNVAYHAQEKLEEVVTHLVSHYVSETGLSKVCLAGGVALNCKMNKRVRELSGVDGMYVQPVANDAGGALGACFEVGERNGIETAEMDDVYHGTSYSRDEILGTLEELKLDYNEPEQIASYVAEQIASGQLVGWFQGSMEAGPRALGNRSILADPREKESLDRVNRYVKHREEWRPFSPSMLPEETERYLIGERTKAARFMIDTHDSTELAREDIPAVLHPEDKTMRPQVVKRDANPKYYKLLKELKTRTGVGVVLNTSYNDSGEPIVRTPREAIRDFFSMGLDLLVLGDLVLEKPLRRTASQAVPETGTPAND